MTGTFHLPVPDGFPAAGFAALSGRFESPATVELEQTIAAAQAMLAAQGEAAKTADPPADLGALAEGSS